MWKFWIWMQVESKELVEQGETEDVTTLQRRQKGMGSESEVADWPLGQRFKERRDQWPFLKDQKKLVQFTDDGHPVGKRGSNKTTVFAWLGT